MNPRFKVIGVIGGMGPLATVDFEKKLLSHVKSEKDQGFPQIISFNNSRIPDRTAALLGQGPSPVFELVRTARTLVSAGAEILSLPCNTSHAFFDDIRLQVDVPIVNMVEEVCNEVKNMVGVSRVGLLATTGTVRSGIYLNVLKKEGIGLVNVPELMQQNNVMDAIYGYLTGEGIKGGHIEKPRALLYQAAQWLMEHGSQVVILGCTELPLVLQDCGVPMIDSTDVLAKSVIKKSTHMEEIVHGGRMERRISRG